MRQRVGIGRNIIRLAIPDRIEPGDRTSTLIFSFCQIMQQRIARDVPVGREVPAGIEKGVGFSALQPSGGMIMEQGTTPDIAQIRIAREIERRIEKPGMTYHFEDRRHDRLLR